MYNMQDKNIIKQRTQGYYIVIDMMGQQKLI